MNLMKLKCSALAKVYTCYCLENLHVCFVNRIFAYRDTNISGRLGVFFSLTASSGGQKVRARLNFTPRSVLCPNPGHN